MQIHRISIESYANYTNSEKPNKRGEYMCLIVLHLPLQITLRCIERNWIHVHCASVCSEGVREAIENYSQMYVQIGQGLGYV